MLPGGEDGDTQNFFSFSHKKLVCRIRLPELGGRRRCIGSSGGYLIIADDYSEPYMLNPLTGARIHLPSITTLPFIKASKCDAGGPVTGYLISSGVHPPQACTLERTHEYLFVKAVFFNSTTGTPMVVVICNFLGGLAFAKVGDKVWIPIKTAIRCFDDVLFYRGLLYALDWEGMVIACDFSKNPSPPREIVNINGYSDPIYNRMYLVESTSGDLLQIWRRAYSSPPEANKANGIYDIYGMFRTIHFKVFKLNQSETEWVEVTSLGGDEVMLADSYSKCVPAQDFPELRGNCIYFTGSSRMICLQGFNSLPDIGVFSLEDGSIEQFLPFDLEFKWPPPVWFTPLLS